MVPKTQISNIRREELTRAAMKCIADKGYDRVTLDDVTREAGLSKGIASYYFNNREELLLSVIQKMRKEVVKLAKLIWELPENVEDEEEIYKQAAKYYADPQVNLVNVLKDANKFIVQWFTKNQLIIKVILQFWGQIPRNPLIAELNESIHQYFKNISAIFINEGIKRGEFKKRNPKMAAYTLLASLTGLALHQIMFKKEFDDKSLEKSLNDLIFDYLQA